LDPLAIPSHRIANDLQDMADARFTLLGSAKPVAEGEVAAARELFLARHAGSFWVDFGDFTWFRLEDIVQGRLVGGFARARTVRAPQHQVCRLWADIALARRRSTAFLVRPHN